MSVRFLTRTALLVMTFAALGAWFGTLNRGLGYGDEGYTMLSILRPENTVPVGEVTLFGFVLHPLSLVTGGNLVAMRFLTCVPIAVTGAVAAWVTLRVRAPQSRMSLPIIGLTGAVLALVPQTFLVPGPGYYALTYFGMLIVAIGVALGSGPLPGHGVASSEDIPSGWLAGWFIAGVGIFLTAAGRPTSGIALVVFLALAALVGRGWVGLASTALGGLVALIGYLVLVGQTPTDLFRYLAHGSEFISLSGTHSFLTVIGWGQYPRPDRFLVVVVPLLLLTCLAAVTRVNRRPALGTLLLAAAVILTLGLAAAMTLGLTLNSFGGRAHFLGLFAGLPALAWVAGSPTSLRRLSRPAVTRLLVLFPAPYIFALGTNTNFPMTMGRCALQVTLAGLVVLVAVGAPLISQWATVTSGACIGALILFGAVAHPAVEGSLWESTHRVSSPVGTLSLTEPDARWARAVIGIGKNTGFTPGTPIIDLTGYSETEVMLLDGSPVPRISLFKASAANPAAARLAFSRGDCSALRHAWLLSNPTTPAFEASLEEFGAVIQRDYTVVGTLPVSGTRLLRPNETAGVHFRCAG